MTNVSPISSLLTTKAIRPGSSGDARLPSQLAPDAPSRTDDVRLSDRALEATPTDDAPIRQDLVEKTRADIAAGLFSDEAIDARLDAIIPAILADIRKL